MIIFKKVWIYTFIVFSPLLFNACQYASLVDLSVSESGFAEIKVNGYNGNLIHFLSKDRDSGSIGYKIEDEIYWIKGMPSVLPQSNLTKFKWVDNEAEISLEVIEEEDDLTFNFRYEGKSKEQPSEWFLNIKADTDEYFTGIFERVVDGKQGNSWKDGIETAMNLRGEKVEMKLKPTVSAYAPFYISSKNYALFMKGTWPGVYDFCNTDSSLIKISFEGPALSFKIYNGLPASLVRKHTMETGPVIIPPKWALGPWRWRDTHRNKPEYFDGTPKNAPFCTDIVEDVLMMQAYDIPHTAVWIDRPWGPGTRGFDDYEFDTNRIPDPEGMIKWLNGKDIELMMWIGPFVMGDMADTAENKGYDLTSKKWKNSDQVLMDFTNEEAVKWWGENGPGKLAKMGIKGFKLDRADGEKLTDSIHQFTSIGTTYRENFNDYPRQYVKATHDAVREVLGDDFILFPRAQYTGSARYGCMWAGDTNGKQEGLRSAVIAMLRCSVMGYPMWGSDVGGYWGNFDNEVTMRWLGLGCFSPLMEVGPTNDKGFWNNPVEKVNKTGVVYDTSLIAAWRLYSKVRMNMVDYINALANEAKETGMPLARPLYLMYPNQKEAWDDWQTYLLGSDLLVSVVWQKGKTKHKLYLPDGQIWIDAWDKSKEYKGGQYIKVEAPKYKTPVFIRKGASVDLGDLQSIWEESYKIASKKPNLKSLEKAEDWN